MVYSFKNVLGLGKQLAGVGRTGEQGFPRTLNKTQLWKTKDSDITCAAGVYTRIGEYTIPPQQVIHLGQGVSHQNPEEMGHLQFDILDDTATNSVEEKGYLKIGMMNSAENLQFVAIEERSELLHNITTRGSQLLLPERVDFIPSQFRELVTGENSKIFIDFKADSADVVVETGIGTGALNTWQLPITVYQ